MVLVRGVCAGFEESKRKTSEAYVRRAGLVLPCVALRGVDVCLVFRERVLGDAVGPCGYRLHSACLADGFQQDLLVAPNVIDFACTEFREPLSCAQMMELCKTLEELHVDDFLPSSTEHMTNSANAAMRTSMVRLCPLIWKPDCSRQRYTANLGKMAVFFGAVAKWCTYKSLPETVESIPANVSAYAELFSGTFLRQEMNKNWRDFLLQT